MLRHKGAEFRLYGGEAVPAPLKGDRLKGRQPEARGFSRVRLHDETYKTKDNEEKEDVVIYTYGDICTEDWTRKEIIRGADIKEALAEEYDEK